MKPAAIPNGNQTRRNRGWWNYCHVINRRCSEYFTSGLTHPEGQMRTSLNQSPALLWPTFARSGLYSNRAQEGAIPGPQRDYS